MGLFNQILNMGKRAPKDKTSAKSRVVTVNLQKKIRKIAFKKRAPRAIREIKRYAAVQMGTDDVRIDTGLNKTQVNPASGNNLNSSSVSESPSTEFVSSML